MNDNPRPPTIAHLSRIALNFLWDDSKKFKYWLHKAEKLRKEAQSHYDDDDLENAFIKFARAATLVMEHLPVHRDYQTLLTEDQKRNLTLNGVIMMESMKQIKPILLQRIVDWDNTHQGRTSKGEVLLGETKVPSSAEEHGRATKIMHKQNLDKKAEIELRKAALLAAQRAAAAGDEERMRRLRLKEDEERETMLRRQEQERVRLLHQQEELRRREEGIRQKKEQTRKEMEISRRQRETDKAAQAVLQTIPVDEPGVKP